MRAFLLAAVAACALGAGAAQAAVAVDAKGDFLSGYSGPKTDDLDVLTFAVTYDPGAQLFNINATFAGDISPANGPGFYVVGVNTGTGTLAPFGGVGQGNVKFNQAFAIQKTGAITLGGVAKAYSATITGNSFNFFAPLADLPATIPGFDPLNYGFNLWPRQATGGLLALADFSPENSLITAAPEPQSWALMIAGFGFAGGLLRRRRNAPAHL